jgi:hypothetical protein
VAGKSKIKEDYKNFLELFITSRQLWLRQRFECHHQLPTFTSLNMFSLDSHTWIGHLIISSRILVCTLIISLHLPDFTISMHVLEGSFHALSENIWILQYTSTEPSLNRKLIIYRPSQRHTSEGFRCIRSPASISLSIAKWMTNQEMNWFQQSDALPVSKQEKSEREMYKSEW